MSVAPLYSVTTPNTDRGLDANVWLKSLAAYADVNPLYGYNFADDFVETLVGLTGTTAVTIDRKWTVRDAAAAGGTYAFANVAGPDGVASLSSTGTTNHFGVEAESPLVIVTPKHATTPRGRVCFQARVDWSTADSVYVGLTEAGTHLSSTSTLPTTGDHIGFYTTDNGATLTFAATNDNAGGTAVAQTFTIPAADISATGTYTNLAFSIEKDGSIVVSVNGNVYLPVQTALTYLAVPIENLCVRLSATAGGGTVAPAILVDDVRCNVDAA